MQILRMKPDSLIVERELMGLPAVAEGGKTLEPEAHAAPHCLNPADQPMPAGGLRGVPHRHVVDHLADPVGAEKAGDQDVGFGPVELLVGHVIYRRGDFEVTALLMIQNAGKDARGVKAGMTVPIDRTVHADQRHRVHVADDAVVIDVLITHPLAPPLFVPVPSSSPEIDPG
jgi:hypothetical protein